MQKIIRNVRAARVLPVLFASVLAACGGGGGSAGPDGGSAADSVSAGPGPGSASGSGPGAGGAAAGTPAGPAPAPAASTAQYQVNTTTAGSQTQPSVAQLADGGHVIAWLSSPAWLSGAAAEEAPQTQGVCWRRFTAAWAPSGNEVCIPLEQPRAVRVAPVGDGFVVAWSPNPTRSAQVYSGGEIQFQRYAVDGSATGPVQQVHAPGGASFGFDLAALDDGGFVVAWQHDPDGDNTDTAIMMRRFSGLGEAVTEPQQVYGQTGRRMDGASVEALAGGGWIIAWTANDDSGLNPPTVYTQRFHANGTPAGAVALLSAEPALSPTLGGLRYGGYVVAWMDRNAAVRMQRFAADGAAAGAVIEIDPPSQQPQGTCSARGVPTRSCPPQQVPHAVQTLEDGSFVIAYKNTQFDGNAANSTERLRRYSADGALLGAAELDIHHGAAALAASSGGVLVAWQHLTTTATDFDVFARRMETAELRQPAR